MKFSVKIAGIFAVVAFALTAADSANAAFTRDLTMGSTGPDVSELQTVLEQGGYLTMPTGVAKGYFGMVTKAAVMKWQAAAGLPATGYFGPMSRAKVGMPTTPGDDDTPSTPGSLDGDGEVKDFDIKAEDDANSAASDQHIATIEFEVEDGDVSLQKVDPFASSTGNANDIWENIESIALVVDGDEIGSVDASDEDEWSEEDEDNGEYSITIDTDEVVFAEGDKIEIEVVVETSDEVETGDSDEDYELWAELRFINGEDVIFYEGDADYNSSDAIDFSVVALSALEITFDENADSPDTDESLDLSADLEQTLVIVDADVEDNQGGTLEDATVEVVIDLSGSATATAALDIDELIEEIQFFVDGDEIDSDDVSAAATVAAGATGATVVYSFDLDNMEVEAEDAFEIEIVAAFNELEDDSEFIGATVVVSEIAINGENQEGDDFTEQDEATSYAATFTATAGDIDIEFTEDPEALVTTTDPYDGTIVFTVSVENNTGSVLSGLSSTSTWEFDVEGYGGITVESVTDEDGNAADASLNDGEDAEYEITLGFTSKSSKDLSIEIEEVGTQNVPVSVTWTE